MHGLQSPYIDRLRKTWAKVPAFEMRLFSQLKLFCSPMRNFRFLRQASDAIASQWGPPGQDDQAIEIDLGDAPGIVPFFGRLHGLPAAVAS